MGTFTQGIPILTQNIHKCKVAYIWLVSNRLRLNNDSAGSRIKEEGMYVNLCLVALSYVARLSLLPGAIYCFLVHVVSTFFCFLFFVFFFRYDCVLCCKSSMESFRIIIFWRILKSKTSMYRAQNNGRSTAVKFFSNKTWLYAHLKYEPTNFLFLFFLTSNSTRQLV